MGKFSLDELKTLSTMPWRELSDTERRAVRSHMRGEHGDAGMARQAAAVLADQTQMSIADAYRVVDGLAETARAKTAKTGKRPPTQSDDGDGEDDVRWEDEPPEDLAVRAQSAPRWTRQAAMMRAHRGKWMRLRDAPTRKLARAFARDVICARRMAFRPAGAYEARAVENPKGSHGVWVRYVGRRS